MKKKLFALLLALTILMGLLPFPAGAAVVASGKCGAAGNEVTWTLERKTDTQDVQMTISGMGAMQDYDKVTDVPWYDYLEDIEAVVVEAGVTKIGKSAFQGCINLKSATLPDGLTSIGDAAFSHCDPLPEIVIPEAVTSIGKNAFGFCSFTKIDIPKNVAEIGESAFYKCAALTEITVNAENTVYSAEDGILFNYDKTALICYPANKSGTDYTAPDTVTEVGSYAFYGASVLKTVTFPPVKGGGLEKIGTYAFAYSVVSELTLPASLKTVEEYAFYECLGLSDADGNAVGKVNYGGNRQQWAALAMGDGNYRLTNSNVIFDDMQQDNVLASGECGALGNNALWSVRKKKVKDDNGKETDEIELLISGEGAMRDYRNATNVPWASYKADADAEPVDYRPQIQKVRVEDGITKIGDYAAYDCANVTELTLPATLESIGVRAFAACAKLVDIKTKLNSEEEEAASLSGTALKSIGNYAFNGCSALAMVTFPETLETIGEFAFLECAALTEITIPSAVTEIGEWAFRKCTGLTTFTMEPLQEDEAPHYMSIGAYGLADCAALVNLSFTENLTVIGDYAMTKCAELKTVTLPSSVTGIGKCAFLSCSKLEAVNVDAQNEAYCTKNKMLMNKDQTYILFYPGGDIGTGCRIPEGVINIASFAFQTASSLKTVIYEGNWSQWQEIDIGEQGNEYLFKILDTVNPDDPTDTERNFYCEKADPNNDADATRVDLFKVEQTDEQNTAKAEVHCGKEVEGAVALCAMYDADGRFLSMESQEMAPGEDSDLSFTLVKKTALVCLFIMDGENLPQCTRASCKVEIPEPEPEPEA